MREDDGGERLTPKRRQVNPLLQTLFDRRNIDRGDAEPVAFVVVSRSHDSGRTTEIDAGDGESVCDFFTSRLDRGRRGLLGAAAKGETEDTENEGCCFHEFSYGVLGTGSMATLDRLIPKSRGLR